MRRLRAHLYDDPSTKSLDLRGIESYLHERLSGVLDLEIDLRAEFFAHHAGRLDTDLLARRIAALRVKELGRELVPGEPLHGEVEYEKRILRRPTHRPLGVMYEGYLLSRLMAELLAEEESSREHLHVVFTNRLIATYDESDGRYHARVIVCGFPSLISTTGIVEAPAKPREFYLALGAAPDPSIQALVWEEYKQRLRDRFIDYDDERMGEVMKGYALQALFHHLLGEAFCSDRRCRLYNAHWQEEVIEAQLSGHDVCPHHLEALGAL